MCMPLLCASLVCFSCVFKCLGVLHRWLRYTIRSIELDLESRSEVACIEKSKFDQTWSDGSIRTISVILFQILHQISERAHPTQVPLKNKGQIFLKAEFAIH